VESRSTTAEFHVVPDGAIPEEPSFTIQLGREFLDKLSHLPLAAHVHEDESLGSSSIPGKAPSKPFIDEGDTNLSTAQAKTGKPSKLQQTPWRSPELEVSERRDPRRRHDADIIFIPERNQATTDSQGSSQVFGWSLDLLPNDAPGARIIHFKWPFPGTAKRGYRMLGELLLRNLIHDRREKPSMIMVPILFVCQGHGRAILQVMLNAAAGLSSSQDDGYFHDGLLDFGELSDESKEEIINFSRELLQRVKVILVFATRIGVRLRRDLKSCGRFFESVSQIPIIYLRPGPPGAKSRTETADNTPKPGSSGQDNENDGKTNPTTHRRTKRKGKVRRTWETLLSSFLGKQTKPSKDKAKKKKNPAPLTRPITPK
jgi:hypothetical protein